MILISIRKHNLSCSRLAVRDYVVWRILNDDKKILMRNELAFVFWGRRQQHDLGQVNTFSKLGQKKIALGYASNRFMTCSGVVVQFLMRHRWAACFLFIKAEALNVASHEHPSPSALPLRCEVAVVFLLFFLSRYFLCRLSTSRGGKKFNAYFVYSRRRRRCQQNIIRSALVFAEQNNSKAIFAPGRRRKGENLCWMRQRRDEKSFQQQSSFSSLSYRSGKVLLKHK